MEPKQIAKRVGIGMLCFFGVHYVGNYVLDHVHKETKVERPADIDIESYLRRAVYDPR